MHVQADFERREPLYLFLLHLLGVVINDLLISRHGRYIDSLAGVSVRNLYTVILLFSRKCYNPQSMVVINNSTTPPPPSDIKQGAFYLPRKVITEHIRDCITKNSPFLISSFIFIIVWGTGSERGAQQTNSAPGATL